MRKVSFPSMTYRNADGPFILGISGGPRGSHEPSITLLDKNTGRIVLVFQEERFNRFKSSISCFPSRALLALFEDFGVDARKKIEISVAPGFSYKDMCERIPSYLNHNFGITAPHLQIHHQICHAANAYYSSIFDSAAIVCLDGVGDQVSGVIAIGEGHRIKPLRFIPRSESVGFFWTLMCQYIGYDGLEDAYKVMGLAPYGVSRFNLDSIFRYEGDLCFFLNTNLLKDKYQRISLHPAENLCEEPLYDFGTPYERRTLLDPIESIHKDIAASSQFHLEECLMSFFTDVRRITGKNNVCLGGGVMMNSHFIGKLQSTNLFDNVYTSPTPGDCGLSMGAAQFTYSYGSNKRPVNLKNAFLGRSYDSCNIIQELNLTGLKFTRVELDYVVDSLISGSVLGFFSGRSEIGPRALGARSILALPNREEVKNLVNSKIKFRESYRPFAPITLEHEFDKYFVRGCSNYDFMSCTTTVKSRAHRDIPATVHVDGTSRVQIADDLSTVAEVLRLLRARGLPAVLLNTSFNLKGEPNVESPKDAIRTFCSSGLDALYIDGFFMTKEKNEYH